MRAVAMLDSSSSWSGPSRPEPGPGEVLVKTLACGICGRTCTRFSHAEKLVETPRALRKHGVMDSTRDVVMGHEFCAEIVDHGPDTTRRFKLGTRVCSMPMLMRTEGAGDRRLLERQSRRLRRVHAAHRGPAAPGAERSHDGARGAHRANGRRPPRGGKARLEPDDVPLVIGCGPVGLAVIAALRLGASSRSSPPTSRRAAAHSPSAGRRRRRRSAITRPTRAGARRRLARPAAPHSHLGSPARRAARRHLRVRRRARGHRPDHGAAPRRTPHRRRRRLHGARHDQPMLGISKELNLQFVLGYTPDEFAATLRYIAEGATRRAR